MRWIIYWVLGIKMDDYYVGIWIVLWLKLNFLCICFTWNYTQGLFFLDCIYKSRIILQEQIFHENYKNDPTIGTPQRLGLLHLLLTPLLKALAIFTNTFKGLLNQWRASSLRSTPKKILVLQTCKCVRLITQILIFLIVSNWSVLSLILLSIQMMMLVKFKYERMWNV